MRAWQVSLGGLGLVGAAYGLVQLLDLGLANLGDATIWLVGGVVLHDGVIAPLTIGTCLLVATRWRSVPAPVVTGAVVLTTLTVVAVPVLGSFGARADNPTLLDRNYVLGWLAVATLTVVASGVGLVATRRSGKGGADGTSTGRR